MMKKILKNNLSVIKAALQEDIGRGDLTTRLLIPEQAKINAVIVAKQTGVVCGLEVAKIVFRAVDQNIRFRSAVSDARLVRKGEALAHLEGRAKNILQAERVALNFLGHLSGIATLTRQYVQRVRPYRVKIMDTRKTTPGLRALEKYAVRCGGGFNHRLGLWDGILVKDNHLFVVRESLFVNGKNNLGQLIAKLRQKKPRGLKIEIEVTNLRQFKQALLAKPDIVMLDNFSLKNIKKAVKIRNHSPFTIHHLPFTIYYSPKLEVSGGVNLDNVRRIAACGVERISIGALTHSAKSLDIALNCE